MIVTMKKPLSERKKASMRVKVALDVLANLRYMKVTRGHYINGCVQDEELDDGLDARKILPQIRKNCKVCALGACVLSHVKLWDKVTVGDLQVGCDVRADGELVADWSNVTEPLGEYFCLKQLNLIENAFEQWNGGNSYDDEFLCFWRQFIETSDPSERLRAIMLNVVANKGTFKPETGIPKDLRTAKRLAGMKEKQKC